VGALRGLGAIRPYLKKCFASSQNLSRTQKMDAALFAGVIMQFAGMAYDHTPPGAECGLEIQ
jgi:alcohol dehydrogenase class IV